MSSKSHPSIILFSIFGLLLSFQVSAQSQTWIASPEVTFSTEKVNIVQGVVFDDTNLNGKFDAKEKGVEGVLVSNGESWVKTDQNGKYEIALLNDMNLTIVQPSGWRVPTNERMVPQFFHVYKENGLSKNLRFGGLPDAGKIPSNVNFPISNTGAAANEFTCAVFGDPQTYSNEQVGYFRDGVINEILNSRLDKTSCMIHLGDVVGDDLGLLNRLLEVAAVTELPQWLVIGNHDIDFDVIANDDKADSWRSMYGPNYYAFEMGNVLFVALDNIVYPCGVEDVANGRENCEEGNRPVYNGRVTSKQIKWLKELVENTPKDRLIVTNNHIPFVSFVDSKSGQHQTDNANEIYEILEGRPALSLSGHTHTTENHAPGQTFEGWEENTGAKVIPFRHIIAGAASGAWYQGDFSVDGVPMSLQRMGAPLGFMKIDFKDNSYSEKYIGANLGQTRGQWIGLNTPDFRNWFTAIREWSSKNRNDRDSIPPFSINDLPDTKILIPSDFENDVWLTANVWAGSEETKVKAILLNEQELTLERTQEGKGEGVRIGAEWADPFSTARQLSVARYALQSTEGEERAQGTELFRGNSLGVVAPQPQSSVADRNMHLWRVKLPTLPLGTHKITVSSTDRNGNIYTDFLIVEVREERPVKYWRNEMWE